MKKEGKKEMEKVQISEKQSPIENVKRIRREFLAMKFANLMYFQKEALVQENVQIKCAKTPALDVSVCCLCFHPGVHACAKAATNNSLVERCGHLVVEVSSEGPVVFVSQSTGGWSLLRRVQSTQELQAWKSPSCFLGG